MSHLIGLIIMLYYIHVICGMIVYGATIDVILNMFIHLTAVTYMVGKLLDFLVIFWSKTSVSNTQN